MKGTIVRLEVRDDDAPPAWLDSWGGEWCTVAHADEAKKFATKDEAAAWVSSVGLMPSLCTFWEWSLEVLP